MLVWSPGQHRGQYSGLQLREMLADAGLRQVESKPAIGYRSVVTDAKLPNNSLGDARSWDGMNSPDAAHWGYYKRGIPGACPLLHQQGAAHRP